MKKIIVPYTKLTYIRNACIYKLLSNPIRLEILNLLRHQEMTATELVKFTRTKKANISKHLNILKKLRLIYDRKQGRFVFYNITDPKIVLLCEVLNSIWGKSKSK